MTEPPTSDGTRAAARAAEALARSHAAVDLQFRALGLRAIEALAPVAGERVADIGCGAGQTVLQLAERVGRRGEVIGVDIAPVLLDIARARAAHLPQARFVEADAQTVALPDGGLEAVYSRFGVMAFADPAAAFRNFHRMMAPGGRLAFVCWRALAENELDLVPLRAAGLEDRADFAPFSFEDPARTRAVLEAAGFRHIAIAAHDAPVSSGDLDAMATVLLSVGALGRVLRETPGLRAAAEPRLREALAARGDPARVSLNAGVWIVTARA